MAYIVSGTRESGAINFAPSGVIEEVLQNVRTLIATAKYSVPLDRALGIDAAFLDRPAPDAMARLKVHMSEQIQRDEPRAIIKAIEFKRHESDSPLAGIFYPVLSVDVIRGDEL
jgi:hypothetical protein